MVMNSARNTIDMIDPETDRVARGIPRSPSAKQLLQGPTDSGQHEETAIPIHLGSGHQEVV
jgi:hypothetical protein